MKNMLINLITFKNRFLQYFWIVFDKLIYIFAFQGIIVASSGGTDSRLFIEILMRYPQKYSGKYIVAIINHHVHKISNKESAFLYIKAKTYCIATKIINITYKYNFITKNEQLLRKKRYTLLLQLIYKHKYISLLTAHSRNDNIESYLMYIMGWARRFTKTRTAYSKMLINYGIYHSSM